ncbi:NIDogen (Basement membrane protein) [Trichostrongylus colubriformis]|uniref:NIDogen (Basement membrane protein) n=1 Tax=Trichostrongylus colubriformis TaxID=6319 RepID=A0AAN8GEM2_TRICO
MRLKLLLLFCVPLIHSQTQLFDYGERAGDQALCCSRVSLLTLNAAKNAQSSLPALSTFKVYMENSYSEIYIAPNGIVGFGDRLPGKSFGPDTVTALQRLNQSAIAAFYAPVVEGDVYFRATSSDQHLLRRLTDYIHKTFADSSDFTTLQAVVVTWESLQNQEQDGGATFQLALASDGMTSYALLQFLTLPWSASGGRYAQSGFSMSDGRHQGNINSGTPDVKELVGNYDQTDYDGDERKPPADCPVDPYSDRCPEGCNILTDERMCSRCVCAEPPQEDENQLPEIREPLPPLPHSGASGHQQPHSARTDDRQSVARKEEEKQPDGEGKREPEPERAGEREREQQPMPEMEQETEAESVDHHHPEQEITLMDSVVNASQDTWVTARIVSRKVGDPQRISGSLEGVINGISIDHVNLHTLVTATDGHAYTALSKVPPNLGQQFLLLNPIGTVMGWLFAEVQSPAAYNGFQLTGSHFNRTVTLHIGDRYHVSIRQQFNGKDVYHYLKVTVFVSGTLPEIDADTEIAFPDYEEEYHRERPGLIRSYTGIDVQLKERGQPRSMRMTIDQQIQYEECPHRTFDEEQSVVLHMKRTHVNYVPDEQSWFVLCGQWLFESLSELELLHENEEKASRYGSRNYIHSVAVTRQGESFQTDPRHAHQQNQQQQPVDPEICTEGRHVCTLPNMRCRPVAPSYRCECLPGFQAVHDTESPLGWKCQDLDECQRGDHTCNRNAVCENTEGSFTCQCRPGYTGDGHHCTSSDTEETEAPQYPASEREEPTSQQKGVCTNHQQCHKWGECAFTEGSPYGVCRCRGWYTGDGVKHCGPPGEHRREESRPEQPRREGERREESRPEQPRREEERREESRPEQPRREEERREEPRFEEPRRQEDRHEERPDQRAGRPCGHHICDTNADCMPSPSGGSECVCRAGYAGNGINCESLEDDDTEERRRPAVQEETVGKVCRAHEECSSHGSCAYSRTLGYYHCVCTEPYVGNGIECTLPGSERTEEREEPQGCDRLRNCDENAQCVYDSHNRIHRCECYEGYAGDGTTCVKIHTEGTQYERPQARPQQCRDSTDCHENGHCVVVDNNGYVCECLPGYRGDGVQQCVVADQCNPTDPSACHQNAECIYGEVERAYVCKCVRGFTGDGVRCVPHAQPQTCREEPRLCHANAQCVYNHEANTFACVCKPGSVGDGTHRCDPQETPRCMNCSVHAHCSQSHTTGGWQCKCNAGYQGNGYVCSAMSGFALRVVERYADSESRDDVLLISRGMAIFHRGTNPEVPGKQLIVIPHHIAVGLDYDCQDARFVWSDISVEVASKAKSAARRSAGFTSVPGHSIKSASLNGTDMKSYYKKDLNSPEGVAVDWSSRNVYYADSLNDEIGVASLDGKYQKALITEGLVNPRALALDLNNRHLYYTDWHRENPIIGRVDMDGRNNRVFLNDDIHLPNGITILPNRRELCWVDAGNHSNRIHSVGIYGDGYTSFPISVGGSGKVYGILAIPRQCIGPATACSVDNGGCPYLCLPGHDGVRCECPSNVAVKGC